MADARLDYAVPADDLKPYVTLFYRFSTDAPLFEDVERADHAQFRFRLSAGPADYRFAGGSVQPAPACHIIGATSGAIATRAAGPVRVFGMGLTPAGWAAILGIDASAMHERVIDAGALFGSPVAKITLELARADDVATMTAIAEPFVRALVGGGDGATLAFVRQVDDWLAHSSSPAIDTLIAMTGLSRRQVERRCNALYGAPPKLLARKYRALRAAVAFASEGIVDATIVEGFYDQSHMIREIKHFTGTTPGRLKHAPKPLAQLTMGQRRALGGRVDPLISDT